MPAKAAHGEFARVVREVIFDRNCRLLLQLLLQCSGLQRLQRSPAERAPR
jgi:hypothetical protein